MFSWHEEVTLTRRSMSRRGFLYGTSAAAAAGAFNFRDVMSTQAAELRKQGKAMILLFMQGGPSQLETDRKSTRLNSSHIPLSRMPSSA